MTPEYESVLIETFQSLNVAVRNRSSRRELQLPPTYWNLTQSSVEKSRSFFTPKQPCETKQTATTIFSILKQNERTE